MLEPPAQQHDLHRPAHQASEVVPRRTTALCGRKRAQILDQPQSLESEDQVSDQRVGAGKSTTVLACLENGFHYISEDYCIVTNDDQPIAYSLYNSAKFTDYTFERFPHLASYKNNNGSVGEKYLVYYNDIYPDKMLHKLPLMAFISLNLQKKLPSSLSHLDVNRSFLDMIASTTLQNPVYELTSTDFFQCLKSKIPAYELTFGSDQRKTQSLLSDLVKEKLTNLA